MTINPAVANMLDKIEAANIAEVFQFIQDRWSTRAIHFAGDADRADRGLAALPLYDFVNADSPPWTDEQIALYRPYFDKPPFTSELTAHFAQLMTEIGLDSVTITPTAYAPAWGDAFNYGYAETSNVYGSITGASEPNRHIILCAHYDSFGGDIETPVNEAPGADDNGLSCAALLEIARVIKEGTLAPNYTVDFVLLGSEETGEDGSGGELYAQSLVDNGVDVLAVINVDMIAYSAPGSSYRVKLHYYSTDEHPTIIGYYVYQSIIKAIFEAYTSIAPANGYLDNTASDSLSFYRAGFPVVYIEEYSRTPYYHTPNDTIENADLDYLAASQKAFLPRLCCLAGLRERRDQCPLTQRLY